MDMFFYFNIFGEPTSQPLNSIQYMYVSYKDTFRVPPVRWLGYSYIVFKLLHLDPRVDKDKSSSSSRDEANKFTIPLLATAVFVTGHALFHRHIASADVSHYMMQHCDPGPRAFYILVSVVESVLWDLLATVVFPYTAGLLTHELVDILLSNYLSQYNPIRRSATTVLTLLAVPILGVVGDSAADRLLGLLTKDKFSLCPPPVRAGTLHIEVLLKDVLSVIFSGVGSYFGIR